MLHFSKTLTVAALLLLACGPTYAVVIQNFDGGSITPASTALVYAGNAGPSAGCAGNNALYGEGTYAVAASANSCHNLFAPTTAQGGSYFMVVNGNNTSAQANIYSQVVSTGITAGAAYNFSAYITGLYVSNPAMLSLRVYDGIGVGGALLTSLQQFNTNLATGLNAQGGAITPAAWVKNSIAFTALSGVVTVQVFNASVASQGNDFGLDTLEILQTSATPDPTATPEPASFFLAGSALIGLCLIRRK